jgi:hypothetical protein
MIKDAHDDKCSNAISLQPPGEVVDPRRFSCPKAAADPVALSTRPRYKIGYSSI